MVAPAIATIQQQCVHIGDKVVFLSPYELPLPYRKSERVYSIGVVLRISESSCGSIVYVSDVVGKKHVLLRRYVHVVECPHVMSFRCAE